MGLLKRIALTQFYVHLEDSSFIGTTLRSMQENLPVPDIRVNYRNLINEFAGLYSSISYFFFEFLKFLFDSQLVFRVIFHCFNK